MTVGELKELINDLPEDMEVFMPLGEDALITACYSKSNVFGWEVDGEIERDIFLIVPCSCHHNDLPIDLETNPN